PALRRLPRTRGQRLLGGPAQWQRSSLLSSAQKLSKSESTPWRAKTSSTAARICGENGAARADMELEARRALRRSTKLASSSSIRKPLIARFGKSSAKRLPSSGVPEAAATLEAVSQRSSITCWRKRYWLAASLSWSRNLNEAAVALAGIKTSPQPKGETSMGSLVRQSGHGRTGLREPLMPNGRENGSAPALRKTLSARSRQVRSFSALNPEPKRQRKKEEPTDCTLLKGCGSVQSMAALAMPSLIAPGMR